MKRKTFIANSAEEIDRLCNEFETTHKIEFTQPSFFIHDRTKYFVVAMLYKEDSGQKQVPNYGNENQKQDFIVQPVKLSPPTAEATQPSNVQIIQPGGDL